MSAYAQKTRVLQISLGIILSSFAVELAFGIISNSLALLTDSIHALLDGVVTAILLVAAYMAGRPPDADHTYGHGKIESLGGLFGGIAILFIAGFFVSKAVMGLYEPQPVAVSMTGIIGGAYVIGADIFRIVFLRRHLRRLGGTSLRADLYHAVGDLGSTVLAVAGVVLASSGFVQGDFIAAMVLGGMLAVLSLKLIYRTAMELTDVISPELVGRARRAAADTAGVREVRSMQMRRSGDAVFADVIVVLHADVSFEGAHDISTAVENSIRGQIAQANVTVHFEPTWSDVPMASRMRDLAVSVPGVRDVHNVSTYVSESRIFADLHVMVDVNVDLATAHKISDEVEARICDKIPDVQHVTVHLEPYVEIGRRKDTIHDADDRDRRIKEIDGIVRVLPQVRDVAGIRCLDFEGIMKVEIDCLFDGGLSITDVHNAMSTIESRIRARYADALVTIHPAPA